MGALVYIGFWKTGSTFLQDVCYHSRSDLLDAGIVYPRNFFKFRQHIGLAVAFKEYDSTLQMFYTMKVFSEDERKAYRSNVIEQLKNIAKLKNPLVLFSSEHLSFLNQKEIENLITTLQSIFDSVRVFVFVRRQDHLALSAYSEKVRFGSGRNFVPPRLPKYDFAAFLEPWENLVGSKNLRVFAFRPETFRKVFFDWVGAPKLAEMDSKKTHASLDIDEIQFLKNFYKLFPRNNNVRHEELRKTILKEIENRTKGHKFSISEREKSDIKRHYYESNRIVEKRYLNNVPIFG